MRVCDRMRVKRRTGRLVRKSVPLNLMLRMHLSSLVLIGQKVVGLHRDHGLSLGPNEFGCRDSRDAEPLQKPTPSCRRRACVRSFEPVVGTRSRSTTGSIAARRPLDPVSRVSSTLSTPIAMRWIGELTGTGIWSPDQAKQGKWQRNDIGMTGCHHILGGGLTRPVAG